MPEWLKEAFHSGVNLSIQILFARLIVAFILGCLVGLVYKLTRRSTGDPSSFITTLVLLTVLIAMVTLVIGDSVARAFSLVGALAIVRFRTVVEDTRDTAFVILAVGLGMAAGTGYLAVGLIGLPIATVAAVIFRPRDPASGPIVSDFTMVVRVGLGRNPEELLRAPFEKHVSTARLLITSTARQGSALELTYAVRLRSPEDALPLVTMLNGIEGLQGVELRQL